MHVRIEETRNEKADHICNHSPGPRSTALHVESERANHRQFRWRQREDSAPANVFFMFPVGTDNNVTEIQFGCSDSPVNRNWVFVYEEQPNGSIVTYPIQTEVACNEAYGSGFTTFTGSLKNDITVNTPDHTINISSATAWTAAKKSGLHGPYWAATGGSSTILTPRC